MTFFRRFARLTSFIFAAALTSSLSFAHADDSTSSDDDLYLFRASSNAVVGYTGQRHDYHGTADQRFWSEIAR